MRSETYEGTLTAAWAAYHMLNSVRDELDEAIRAAEHAEGIGPILDPTAWRQNIGKLQEDLAVLRAAREFAGTRVRR